MAPKTTMKTKLFLLDPVVPATGENLRDLLWGAIVAWDPNKPTEHFSSNDNAAPLELVPYLMEKTQKTPINRYEQVVNAGKYANVRIKLQRMLSVFWDSKETGGRTTDATRAEYWHMTSPTDTIRQLLRNKTYKRQVIKFIKGREAERPGGTLFFVTDILTLESTNYEASTKEHTKGGGSVDIPNHDGSALGKFEGGKGWKDNIRNKGKIKPPMITAIGYHKLSYRKVRGFKAWWARVFRGHSFVVQTVSSIGNSDVYELSIEDAMAEGDVPIMSSKRPDTEGFALPLNCRSGGDLAHEIEHCQVIANDETIGCLKKSEAADPNDANIMNDLDFEIVLFYRESDGNGTHD